MVRLCVYGVFLAVLLAGGVNSSDSIRNNTVNEGESFSMFVTTNNHVVKTCHLKTPSEDFDFAPGDVGASTEKYTILASQTGMACLVTAHNLNRNDNGLWVMTYDHESEDAANAESVNLTVNVSESEEDEKENVTSLSVINHSTRQEMFIDISLDKKSFEEECYVQAPAGVLTKVENFKMEHVTVQRSSNYVSCRITLGPMSESLLGDWRLCGKSTETDEMRCQPANIIWNNNNPNADWHLNTQSMFSHPVHYGGTVNPGVVGTGDVESCHVVTPDGEDLVITSDVAYPHIERIAFDRQTLCSINFTNIVSSMIGEWTIYGKFRSSIFGLNEMHLPLKFYLYNEEQPYEQAYNVTTLPDDSYLVTLGNTLEVSVKSFGQVDNCQYKMPTGQSYDLSNAIAQNDIILNSEDSTPAACRLALNAITKDMVGEWQLIGKFSDGNQFAERRQPFQIIQEDPTDPIVDDFRVVENLTEVIVDTELGASHTVTIITESFVENESCHLMTPSGLQYAFIDGFNIPNVEILEGNGIECGINVHVLSLDMLGEWTLIARATRLSIPIERRRSFTIRIEETSSLGNPITIAEGADLYLSLPNPIDLFDTCKLYGPNDEEFTNAEVDQLRYTSCGYIVRNVNGAQRGTWTIVYGNQITYRSTVEVNILESAEISVDNMVWTAGSSVNITLGPVNTVYCRLIDSTHSLVFDGFGQCRIALDRVTMAHRGAWTISVGVPGTVILRHDSFYVDVLSTDFRPPVTTEVTRNGSSVVLTCSVPVENEVQACMFRDPTGNILIASHGVGQDGYTGAVVRYESDSDRNYCSLRLLSPSSEHQGIWRCAVNTARATSYAFLTITGAILDQSSSYSSAQPELTSTSTTYGGVDGDAVTMSCSIDAAVRYCYFRTQNGTVFNVGPSTLSENYEYIGNGLDAGECGIRFKSLWRRDSGNWSCHVGLVDSVEEHRSNFEVSVSERTVIEYGWEGSAVKLRMSVVSASRLEYCRFVRIDGHGFTSDNVPSQYIFDSNEMTFGACDLVIPSPTILDMHPWTVFAKVVGTDGELSMTTSFKLPPQGSTEQQILVGGVLLWTFFAILCVLLVLAAVSLIPRKNRNWTYQRAASIRNSFRKQPQPNDILTDLPQKV